LTGPAIGEPDPGRAASARPGFLDAADGILILLAAGLAFRLIIAYLLPGSGFASDLSSFQGWASDLARNGLHGFYDRPGFHDYTPGYLYVLWLIGLVGQATGGIGDMIKIPPILGDLALAYLVWSMLRELGASERSAKIGALIVLVNPVTWFDSVVWGQVDSVGVVVLLLGLRELWRDRPERAAILAALAALIKPQLGILIPIVAIVVIRRAFWPKGGYGAEDEPEPLDSTLGWEDRIRGPIRVVTTGVAGFLTAILLSLPFGLSLPGLISQVFKTAGGYPYVSVNAFNPWALVTQRTADGREEGIAASRSWVCDSQIVAAPPSEFRIGPFVIPELSFPGSTVDQCPDGVFIGAFPAALVGMALFLIAAAIVLWFIARRPDRLTMVTGLAVLALAFFILPTRVHERYLFPLTAIGAILAAVSLRWRVAYILSVAATFANMYVVLVNYYPINPGVSDWLGVGPTLASWSGVAIAAVTQTVIFGWTFLQLRGEAVEDLVADVAISGRDPTEQARAAPWLGRPLPESDADAIDRRPVPATPAGELARPLGSLAAREEPALPDDARPLPRWAAALASGPSTSEYRLAGAGAAGAGAAGGAVGSADVDIVPRWAEPQDAGPLGPWAWFKARLADRPLRADRSSGLQAERGGRLDKLDVWVLALLAIALLTVRMWRLPEPYQMHFDEVYHPRTATEFLQYWRYGISHDIYEWTHPHMAKYAMALGIVAFGEDKVGATSELGVAVVDATIEPRRDDGQDAAAVEGDRVWVATGSEVRAYDLGTRALVASIPLTGAVALAFDDDGALLYIGTRSGEVLTLETTSLDFDRLGGLVTDLVPSPWTDLDAPISKLFLTRDADRLAVVLAAGAGGTEADRNAVAIFDTVGITELARPSLPGVTQLTDPYQGDSFVVGTSSGLTFIDESTGIVVDTVALDGPVMGVVGITDIENDPIYAAVETPTGPKVSVVVIPAPNKCPKDTAAPCPRIDKTFLLPGATAGRAFYDQASRMVHVEGSVGAPPGVTGGPTVYVIEPHGFAVYADSVLPWVPAAIVMDDNQEYPSTDRQQLLAFDAGGTVASVEIGKHAYAWRVPGVIAGVLMALVLYVLARILFQRRSVAVILGVVVLVDGMLFAQSRIGMNDSYVGLGIVAAYTIFAALWLHPGNSRRHWLAFAIGMPIIGGLLGFALASKWVAAYAIGALGILALIRSALGRLLVIVGLLVMTTALGYVAISVAEGQTGGNYVFLAIMVGLVVIAVLANVLHPVAWTWDEMRLAVGAPVVAGILAILYGLQKGDPTAPIEIGPIAPTAIEIGMLGFLSAAGLYTAFLLAGRFGFGPFAAAPVPDDPAAILDPPADPPKGWLQLGAGFGLPALWLALCLLVIPVGVYVASYLPWAQVENHQLVEDWPPGHTGQTLLDLTGAMYRYHNNLSSPHPASSPWWAWAFDLKPVWFYEEGFAGRTSASIYDAGNLVAWWLAIPAMGFVVWQAFKRRSPALALVSIAFAVQWISWSRIDRAAFQYHYYTALPFLFLALAYFLGELWHGPSRRTWLFARLAAGAAVLLPFTMYLFHRPLCALARVTEVNEGSQACPTLIPDVTVTPRAVAMAVVIGVGVLLLLRELLTVDDDGFPPREGVLARFGLGGRLTTAALIAAGTSIAFVLASTQLSDAAGIKLTSIPVEPIALVVVLALTPVAAYVATARDSRRFVLGALGAMAFWFILWYPNIAALPLPAAIHNAYQGFLPTYLYPFQFWVATERPQSPSLFALGPAVMFLSLAFTAAVVGYSAWSWRIALAERRRDMLAGGDAATGLGLETPT
jgi:Gpi18-like mannosyltransferase